MSSKCSVCVVTCVVKGSFWYVPHIPRINGRRWRKPDREWGTWNQVRPKVLRRSLPQIGRQTCQGTTVCYVWNCSTAVKWFVMFALSYNKSTKRCGLCLVVLDIECTVIAVPVFTIYERDLLFIYRILPYSYWQVCVEGSLLHSSATENSFVW